MDSLLLSLALCFSSDFNKPLPELEFKVARLDSLYGKADKVGRVWVITLDSATVRKLYRSPCRLKSLVYHELGHVVLGLPDTDRRKDFMNSNYCLTRYEKLKNYYHAKPFNRLRSIA